MAREAGREDDGFGPLKPGGAWIQAQDRVLPLSCEAFSATLPEPNTRYRASALVGEPLDQIRKTIPDGLPTGV